jgi:hypothetical protein
VACGVATRGAVAAADVAARQAQAQVDPRRARTQALFTPRWRARRGQLEDGSADAFAKVVDRLLASQHYGERWGRHWLDVARYADSNGLDENVAFGNAWRYRDYVVAALNQDKPYDQFLLEQLAGDLLPDSETARRDQRLIATGFLALGPKVLAEGDEKARQSSSRENGRRLRP